MRIKQLSRNRKKYLRSVPLEKLLKEVGSKLFKVADKEYSKRDFSKYLIIKINMYWIKSKHCVFEIIRGDDINQKFEKHIVSIGFTLDNKETQISIIAVRLKDYIERQIRTLPKKELKNFDVYVKKGFDNIVVFVIK